MTEIFHIYISTCALAQHSPPAERDGWIKGEKHLKRQNITEKKKELTV